MTDQADPLGSDALLERLVLVQEAAGVGVFDDDLDESHIEWDDRMRAIWGVPADQTITRELFLDSILPDDRPHVQLAFETACNPAGNRRFVCEYRIRRQSDGDTQHVAVTGIVTVRDGRARRLVGSARDVSLARRNETARSEALEAAEGLLATAPTLIYVYDLVERRNVYLSPQGQDILALGKSDLQQWDRDVLKALVHPDDLESVAAHHQAIRSGALSEPFQIEYRMRHRDGHYVWLASKEVVHQRDTAGRPTRILGASLDVSALKAAEESARASARLLQAVVDAVPSLVFVKDHEGRYRLANNEALKAIGRPWEEVEGRSDEEWTEPSQLAVIRGIDRQVIELGRTMEAEEPFHHDALGPRTFLTRKTPLLDDDGRVTGLVGAAIEVTDRVRATSNLAASEARLRRVLDQLFAFVGVAAPDGVLLWANRAPLQLAGLTEEDVVGKRFWETHWWSYSSVAQAKVRDATERAAQGETVRFDIPVIFTDATPKTIDFQVAPLFDDEGRVLNLIPSGILIEDRVQAERARELLIGELHHRVKNIYAVVSAMVQRSARSAVSMDALVSSVCGRLDAMARVHDLIRPTEGGQNGPVHLRELALEVLRPLADRDNQICLQGDAVTLVGDAVTPMALILHELATNASKYGALSIPTGRVELRWELVDERMVVTWSESGGPRIDGQPDREGFGSRLIRASAEMQLRGAITRIWRETGCCVTLEVPATTLFRQPSMATSQE